MGCQEENTFLRYGDTPSLDNAGFVKVASSHDQLENMSLEDKERIVASVALLDSFSESLSNKLNNLVQNITPKIDDQELEDKVTDLINTLNANNNTESLDIKQVFALQRLNSLELKWITPNYSKPYKVRVFKNDKSSYAGATLLGVVNHTQDYRTILESEIGTDEKVYFFVRAYDGETQGANSPITSFDGKDWLDSLIKMLRGKITETLLSRELIDSIYTGFGNKLNNEIEKTLQQARNSVIESERTINNVITQLRGSIDQELVSVKGQLQDQGTDIQTLERKSEGLAEQITRISAVADNAIAGIQEERIARATENEAFARETNTRIAQTNNAIATVRDDLKVQTDNYQSLTQKVEDYKNIYDQNEVRTTQKFEQIANENEATQRTLRDTTAKTESATVKIRDLEEAKATSDRATAKRFSSLRSSINGSHFPNYNFEGELEGWTSHEGNTLTFKRIEDPSAPVPDVVEITGNMPMWIYSNEPTKIEIHKTYTLTAIVKSPTGLKSAKLVMMCYDKNKNLIRNIQTEPNHPLIEEQRNKGSQWVKLSGKVTEHSTTYPTTDRDKIPLHAVYATPALILESAIGGHFWVTQLDMQDTSQEENNLALINETKETLNTDRQSTALKFSEMETKFRDTESNIQGVAGQVEQVKSDVKKIDGRVVAEAEKAEQLTARVGRNEGAVQSLTRVINDEKSSTATKLEEMKSSFRRDLSNVIQNPDFLETRVTTTLNEQGQAIVTGSEEVPSHKDWNVAPPNKVRVITYDQNPITEHKTKFPSKYYLKTWANSVTPLNALSVSPNDKIYVSLGVYAQAATIPTEVYIRYSDKDNNLVSQHKLGSVSSRQTVKLSDTLTVPENATKAELIIFTGRDNLAESTGYTLISKPELRMNMAAIYADAKIEEAKLTISNENEALAQKVERLTADHNETKASVQREVNARAEKDNAITSEIETMKTSLEGANAEIVSIKATQVTDKQASAKALDQLSTDFNKKIGDLDVKSSSAIKSASDTFNDATKALTQKVDTQKSEFDGAIQKVNRETNSVKEIANKATSDISEIKTTINELDRSVVAKTEQLESNFNSTITEKALELNNKLANIKVGGRNLLWFSEVNSEKHNYWHGTKHANSSTVLTNADGNLIVNFNDTANLWTQWQQYGYTNGNWVVNTDLEKLEGDQEYTVSFKALNETGKNISTKVVIARDVTSGSRLDGFVKEVIIPPSTNSEWFNASVTGTLSSNIPNNFKGNRFLIVFQNANSGTLKLKNLQLEKGNIRTDWEMSQHDLDTLIEDSVSPVRTIAVEAKSSVNTLQQAINDAKGAHATLAYSLDARYRATKEETKREAVSEAQTLANNAKREAINEADKLATSAKDSAIATASTDATNKANQAVQQAINWQIITARTDLNTLTNQGKFFIRFISNPNAPITNHIYVSVDKAADNRITQSVQADNNPTLKYTRYWNGSTWTDWNKEPTTAEVQEVKTKVDNLKIGGRNYLIATDTFGGWKENVTTWHYAKHQSEPTTRIEPIVDPSLNGTSSITGREFKYLTLKKESAQGIFAHWYQVARMGSFAASDNASPSLARVQIGKEYTLSFEAKNANTGTQPLLYIFREHKTSGFYNVTRQTINIDSQDWKRYSVTFTLNLDSAGLIALNYFTSIFEMAGVGEVHIRKPMLEEGNLPSDWVLAPEDTQLSLNEFAVSFDTYKGSVANDRLALGRQLEQITASLNSSANLVFDSEFSDGLAEQLDKEAGAITGYHRSILGDGRNAVLDAKKPVGFNVGYVGDPNSNASSYKYFTTCEVPVVPGIYQLSIYIRNESNTTASCYVGLLDSNRSGISIPSGAYKDLTPRTVSSVEPKTTPYSLSDFTRVVFNVDLSSVANLSYIRLTSRLNYITTNSPTNFIYFTKPMISKVSSKDAGIVEYSPGPNRGSIKANIKNVETALATETQARVQIERDLTTNFQNSAAGRKIQEVATSTANSATAQYNEVLMARISGASGANLLPDPTFKQFLSNGELRYYLPYKNGAGNTLFNFEVIPNVGLQGSNAIRCSWDNTTTSTTKGFYLRTISNRPSSIPSNPTELQLTSLLPYYRFYNPNQEVIVAVAARVPTGITPSGTLTLSACNAPYFDNSSITYLKRPNLTNEWQWFVMRGKKTANPNATRDDEYFITIAQQTQDTTAIEFCLPYVSPGSEWVEYKSPDYSSSLVNTYAQISSTREIAVDAQGKVKAKIGLTVDSNGRVTGWQAEEGLTNAQKAQQSSFTIFADKFKITTSSLTDPKTPFSIDSSTGKIKFNGEVEFSNVLSPPSIPKTITVVGTSNYVPTTERYPYIQVDDRKVVTNRNRGLTITVLHKDTLEVLSTRVHDTYTTNGCSAFLTDLDQKRTSLGENILILHSFDASINNANLITALNGISTSVGSTIEKALTERVHTSFALIYQKVGNDTVLSYNVNSSMPNNVAVMATHYKGKLLAPSSPMPTTLAEISRIAQEKADSKDQLIADAKSEAIAAAQTYTNTVRDNLELVKLISAQGAYNNNNAWIKVNNVNVSYTASEGIVLIVLNLTNLSEYHKNVYPNTTAGITSLHSYLSSTTLNGKLACIVSRCNVAVATANSTTFRDAFRRAGSTDLIYKTLKEKTNHTFALIGKIGSNGSAVESVVEVGASNIYGDLASVTTNWLKGDIVPTDVTMIDGGRIVTNTITAAHLQADSIDASKVRANTLTVDKLAFNTGAVNLLVNSQLLPKDLSRLNGEVPYGWATYQNVPVNGSWLLRSGKTGKSSYDWGSGETERYIYANANANQYSSGWIHAIAQDITLGSGFYCFSFYATNHGGNANDINCLIENINSFGGYVSQKAISTQHEIFGSGNFAGGYHNSRRYWVTFEVKSTDTYNRFRCGVFINNYATRQGLFFGRPMLEQVTSLNSKPSPFQHSSTRLDPNHLYVPSLSSLSANIGHVTAGTVEGVYLKGSNLQVGNAHDVDGNGNITRFWNGGRGTHIATDGTIRTTAIEIRANFNTNPGYEVINVNDRFKVFRDGTLKIGAKAHGVVIDANGMRVYDGGNLKVRIGNLANNISGD